LVTEEQDEVFDGQIEAVGAGGVPTMTSTDAEALPVEFDTVIVYIVVDGILFTDLVSDPSPIVTVLTPKLVVTFTFVTYLYVYDNVVDPPSGNINGTDLGLASKVTSGKGGDFGIILHVEDLVVPKEEVTVTVVVLVVS
jgi:hypothetical protein